MMHVQVMELLAMNALLDIFVPSVLLCLSSVRMDHMPMSHRLALISKEKEILM